MFLQTCICCLDINCRVMLLYAVVCIFEGFNLAFKNICFQEQQSLAASVSPLESINCSLTKMIHSSTTTPLSFIKGGGGLSFEDFLKKGGFQFFFLKKGW